VVRAQLLGASTPRYSGVTCWRGVATVDHPRLPDGQGLFTLARGAQSGLHRCGQGRVYWFVAVNAEEGGHDAPGGHKAAVLEVVRGWKTPVPDIIEATDEAKIIRNDIADRAPSDRWGDRRVTLLGDAIHSTTPNLGQGACMAIEDGVVLAQALKGALGPDGEGVEAGLRAYEDSRRERTRFVTHTSHRLGFLFHLENSVLVKIRNWLMQREFSRKQGLETFEKLLLWQPPEL
jgi:2-polyprenyl-6-methoxyphenol hydroxylase-like FAD-dependent oxidoreductase